MDDFTETEDVFLKANALIRTRDYAGAKKIIFARLRTAKDSMWNDLLVKQFAMIESTLGKRSSAIKYALKAEAVRPDDVASRIYTLSLLMNGPRNAKAVRLKMRQIERGLKYRNRDYHSYLTLKGMILLKERDAAGAVDCLIKSYQLWSLNSLLPLGPDLYLLDTVIRQKVAAAQSKRILNRLKKWSIKNCPHIKPQLDRLEAAL